MTNLQPKSAAADEAVAYPIRTVSALTGVNVLTLRAWERRYGLVKPVRTAGGHRVFTRTDIDTIQRIVSLVDNGAAIGQVKHLLDAQPVSASASRSLGPWAAYRARMAAAIARFDEDQLEDAYNELLARHPDGKVTREVLLPLLVELGERWKENRGAVAEEHFLAAYLRNKMGARFHHRGRNNTGAKLVVACLPGEHHEIGMLLFALAAHEAGFRIVLLGADMPLGELAHAARRAQAGALVLSGSIVLDKSALAGELGALVNEAAIPVFLGGATSLALHDTISAAGAIALGCDIEAGVARIKTVLAPRIQP